MTAEKMQYNFGIELDQYSVDLDITSDDIFYFLNKSQLDYVENQFAGINPTRRGFEQSQQLIDRLKPLYTKDKSLNAYYAGGDSGTSTRQADRAEFPSDLMYLISHRSEVEFPASSSDIEIDTAPDPSVRKVSDGVDSKKIVVHNRTSQSDDIYKLLDDPFNKPRKVSPIVDIHESYIDIYTDNSFIVNRVIINYIRQPKEIIFVSSESEENQDCELPDFTHEEIVENAVNMLVESRRKFQTNANN